MNTVTIRVATPEEIDASIIEAWETGEPQGCFITFPTPELLWKTLTPKRWEIIKAMAGAGPLGIRELARRVDRDVKGVHTDAQALVQCGVLEKADDGKLEFPYDAVHVDFMVHAA
ncbi:Predicted transcriptional regulator [Azotobacter beijerinckii]|uniref:Predicted transcriptional regulator n=1 Tax=Azotobacter beijerinckii TaxID=170623 RepID=A0A1H9PYY3_9GAMM|nr:transcriptional regulator [Azotobacter beijerinckii]SEJ28929.1 Predicted transcriptional regulator [Azotobacter beijerinckii]SER53035.1 Predicted transcriptional regulator [Azotobacter beijerinckii]